MVKKISLGSIVSSLLLVFFLISCNEEKDKFDDSILWKISGNGLEKPSYIFGTRDMLHASFLNSIVGFEDAFNSVNQFVGETDFLTIKINCNYDSIKELSKNELGDGYKKRLSDLDYKRLQRGLASSMGMSLEDVGDVSPTLLANRYYKAIYYKVDSTYNPICEDPMNIYLAVLAKSKGLPLISLESANDRISKIFDSETFDTKVVNFIYCIENPDLYAKTIKDLDTFYKEQSLSKIRRMYTNRESSESYLPLLERQYEESRKTNAEWMKTLPVIMKNQSSFIAVGVLYLVGADGLLSRLAESGYTVEPVY